MYDTFIFFKKRLLIFFTTYNDEKFKTWKRKKIGDNIIKDVKILFRLKKEIDDTTSKDVRSLFRLKNETDDTVKDIRYLFRLQKENEATKNRIIRDIRNLFEHEEDHYKPVRVSKFGVIIIFNMKVTVIKNKTLSVEYLSKIRPIINDLKKGK